MIVFGPVLKEDNVILYKYPWQDSNDGKSEAEELHRWPIKPQQNSTKYEFSISIPVGFSIYIYIIFCICYEHVTGGAKGLVMRKLLLYTHDSLFDHTNERYDMI